MTLRLISEGHVATLLPLHPVELGDVVVRENGPLLPSWTRAGGWLLVPVLVERESAF